MQSLINIFQVVATFSSFM